MIGNVAEEGSIFRVANVFTSILQRKVYCSVRLVIVVAALAALSAPIIGFVGVAAAQVLEIGHAVVQLVCEVGPTRVKSIVAAFVVI